MACPHCGSWAVRADRSLAGRSVCGRCGRPLQGVKAARQGAGRRRGGAFSRLRGAWRLGLLGVLAAAAALAALTPSAPPAPPGAAAPPLLQP